MHMNEVTKQPVSIASPSSAAELDQGFRIKGLAQSFRPNPDFTPLCSECSAGAVNGMNISYYIS